jgi:hypothetical protein
VSDGNEKRGTSRVWSRGLGRRSTCAVMSTPGAQLTAHALCLATTACPCICLSADCARALSRDNSLPLHLSVGATESTLSDLSR